MINLENLLVLVSRCTRRDLELLFPARQSPHEL
jgi:hypothetical protein